MCVSSLDNIFTRLWMRPLLIILYILFVIIVVPLLILNSVKDDGFFRKDQLILIGGLFVICAIPISIWHITQHVAHLTKPQLQKHIIRILWMVPIYALNAWLCLLFPDHAIYMDSVRECYEAYVIYNFMKFLLNYLNLEMDLEMSLEYKPQVYHYFPLCWMTPWTMGRDFVHNCKHGILQYTVIRPITTIIALICEVNGVYGEGTFQTSVAYPYIIFINNITQFVSMYCLVLFYKANREELKPMKPIPKFLCIKTVVFFSFFQGVVINFLVYFGFIKNIFGSAENDDYKVLSSKLQNFLICIEMFLAALAHHYSFPHNVYHLDLPHYRTENTGSWFSALLSMFDMSDVRHDVSEHFGVVGSSLSRRLRGRSMYHSTRGLSGSKSINDCEREYLVNASGSKTNLVAGEGYQSGINISGNQQSSSYSKSNRYGAVDSGINIIKPKNENAEYTPNEGAPKLPNIFKFNDPQNKNSMIGDSPSFGDLNTSSKSEPTFSTSDSNTGRGEDNTSTSQSHLLKSDSNNSDWLSTPDEVLGIDVKGVSNDRINYNPDRNA